MIEFGGAMSAKLLNVVYGRHSRFESFVGRASQSVFVGRVLVGTTDRRERFHYGAHQCAAIAPDGFPAPVLAQEKRGKRTAFVKAGDVWFFRYAPVFTGTVSGAFLTK
ncbi:MAG: hypothetical protein CMN10_17490 [Roseobacter sp.]|nr:hypothetical protein [Roseobacter sp.]MBV50337.1 hypothetical protein [Roseobacter sp.]